MLGEGGRAHVLRGRDRLERQQGGQLVPRPLKTSEWMVSTYNGAISLELQSWIPFPLKQKGKTRDGEKWVDG